MIGHKPDIFEDLLANGSHVIFAESQELVIFRDFLKVDVFEAILLHYEGLVHFSVDDAALEVKLTDLVFDTEE